MISEMIHTASLVHDDVIDGSDKRRGKSTINEVWGERKVGEIKLVANKPQSVLLHLYTKPLLCFFSLLGSYFHPIQCSSDIILCVCYQCLVALTHTLLTADWDVW